MRLITCFVGGVLSALIGIAGYAPAPARFDMQGRTDFFAGFAGDSARLAHAMEVCERALADNPNHAEALVWHGSGLTFQAGTAFRNGDAQAGMDLFARGTKEMDDAVALEPDNVGV